MPSPTPTWTPTPTATPEPAPIIRGVSLSPRSYEAGDFTTFFTQASQAGSVVRWAGEWPQLGQPGAAPQVVVQLAAQYGYTPVIETGVYSVSQKRLFRPLDQANMEQFVQDVATFAAQFKPPYLGIGVEVNIHYEEQPEEFQKFVTLFDQTYDAVKAASPTTRVYTVFQYERMKGLHGGLFGGQNDPSLAQWDLLELFPKADLVGFTTYPSLIYKDPWEIPEDYYLEVLQHTSKPVAFTETGWPAETVVVGWESDEAEQAEFVDRMKELTLTLKPVMLVWLHLYDQPGIGEAFKAMSLRREDGSARPAWDSWVNGW